MRVMIVEDQTMIRSLLESYFHAASTDRKSRRQNGGLEHPTL